MRSSYAGTRPSWLFGTKYTQSGGRQVDWDQIPDSYRNGAIKVTVGANAIATATSVTLTVPLGTTLSKGQTLDLGGLKFIRLGQIVVGTGAPVAGIVVDALVTAISNGDIANVGGVGPKFVPSGTIMQELTSGKVVPLSVITLVFTAVSTAKGTNTGNGVLTVAGTGATTSAKVGNYRVIFIEPTTNLGTFIVEDPSGVEIGEGVVGTAFSNQVAFTIADGATDFISGDEFTLAVTEAQGNKCAGCIITDATQGSLTDAATGYGMVISGVVWENLMPDAVAGVLTAAQKAALNTVGRWFYDVYADTRA